MSQVEIELLDSQMDFVQSEAPYPAISGGLGCVHPDTKVWTEHGLMRICEITSPIRVLSWNEKDQIFQLSLSGGSFPKGRANLLQVRCEQGGFLATSHHRSFSFDRIYEPVGSIRPGSSLSAAPACLLRSIAEHGLKWLPSDDRHSSQTNADYLGRYADAARRCGLQLHPESDSGQVSSREPCDAHKSHRMSGLSAYGRMGVQEGRKQAHSHHGLSSARFSTMGFFRRLGALASVVAHCISALFSGCTWHCRRKGSLFREMFASRRKGRGFSSACEMGSSCDSPLDSRRVLGVSVAERDSVYYDMQVLETNNYVDEHGFIHHNSGKSRAATMRAITMLLREPGINILIGMPTYDLIRMRILPGLQEELGMIGMAYHTHKTEWSVEVKGFGKIYMRSYDNPGRWIAFEAAHTILDELDTLAKDKAEVVWRKATERTRQHTRYGNSIANVTTPDHGIHGFTYERWVKEADDEHQLIIAKTSENIYLPSSYIAQIRRQYDEKLAEIYLNGGFVNLTGSLVYHFFDREECHTDREYDGERICIGVDFNVGGCCASVWIVDGIDVIAVDEFVSHDTHEMVLNTQSRYGTRGVTFYPDASGKSRSTNASQSDIDILESAGYAVDAGESNPPVRDRVNCVNRLISQGRMKVNTSKCPELTNALENQGYNKKGEPEKFDHHPAIDDWTDGAGYFIHQRFPVDISLGGKIRMG